MLFKNNCNEKSRFKMLFLKKNLTFNWLKNSFYAFKKLRRIRIISIGKVISIYGLFSPVYTSAHTQPRRGKIHMYFISYLHRQKEEELATI